MGRIHTTSEKRRSFLAKAGILTTGAILFYPTHVLSQGKSKEGSREATKTGEEIPATESLMRAHGLLHRFLLIYDEVQARMNEGRDFPPEVLITTANMIRRFVENYHNNMEQGYVFPCFEKANKFVNLVRVLWQQHRVGRLLTGFIMNNVAPATLEDAAKSGLLAHRVNLFVRMYRAHAAFEDTVIFPAFRSVISVQEFVDTGEKMQKKERDLFGANGFSEAVESISEQEKKLGIHDLAQFTPAEG